MHGLTAPANAVKLQPIASMLLSSQRDASPHFGSLCSSPVRAKTDLAWTEPAGRLQVHPDEGSLPADEPTVT
ncbi:MAG TPA: hypothetical protein VI320_03015 [Terracidiphilus sp.]